MYQLNTKKGGFFSGLLKIAGTIAGGLIGSAGGPAGMMAGAKTGQDIGGGVGNVVDPVKEAADPIKSAPLQPMQLPTIGTYMSGGYGMPNTLGEQKIPGVPSFAEPGNLAPENPTTLMDNVTGQPVATVAPNENVSFGGDPKSNMGFAPDPLNKFDLSSEELMKKFMPFQSMITNNKVPTTQADVNPVDKSIDSVSPLDAKFDIIGMKNMGDVAKMVASLVAAVDDSKRARRGKGPGALSRFLNSYEQITAPKAQADTDRAEYIDEKTGDTYETVVDKTGNRIGKPWLKKKKEITETIEQKDKRERDKYLFEQNNKAPTPSDTEPKRVPYYFNKKARPVQITEVEQNRVTNAKLTLKRGTKSEKEVAKKFLDTMRARYGVKFN